MIEYFDVESIFFTILGYPMSFIEFFGTMTCLVSVWLVSKRHMATWPVGIVSVLLFLLLFYQIRLYSDALEQVYYLGASIYGWSLWTRSGRDDAGQVEVRFGSRAELVTWAAGTLVVSALLGGTMSRIHAWIPSVFPEPAALPFLDALTTVMSFTAMWLMVKRRIESWIYWIAVDVIAVGLYASKGVKFVAILYAVLLCLATRGFFEWRSGRADRATSPSAA